MPPGTHKLFMDNNLNGLGLFVGISFRQKAANAVWRPTDVARILSEAASRNAYMQTVKLDGVMPDPDTVHGDAKEVMLAGYHEAFLTLTGRIADRIARGGCGRTILILDLTHEPFYGRTQSRWIHGYRPRPGSRGSWMYAAASIATEDGQRRFIDAFPVGVLGNVMERIVRKLLDNLPEGLLGNVSAVLLDRGFASEGVVKLLEARKLPYLMLCPEWSTVKKAIRGTKGAYSRQEFTVGETQATLVLRKDNNRDFWWKFLTNMGFYHYSRYVHEYRKRWNIETGFRMQDEARIKTKSVEVTVRYFLFLAAMVLYNVWKGGDGRTPFKRFLMLSSLEMLGVECIGVPGPT